MVFVIPIVEHFQEQETVQWVHHEGLIQRPITPRADTLLLLGIYLNRYKTLMDSQLLLG